MAEDKNNKSEEELDIEYQLNTLRTSYEMYEATKVDTLKRRKEMTDKQGNLIYSDKSTNDTLKLIQNMEDDIIEKYKQLGGDVAELTAKKRGKKKGIDRTLLKGIVQKVNIDEGKKAAIDDELKKQGILKETKESEKEEKMPEQSYSVKVDKSNGNRIQYDVVPLPSGGQCYASKMDKVPVAYLNAYDENLIVSPNLYNDGTFIDYMLQSKIMSNEVDPDELIMGDRDAIILWLRATGYGNEFPVTVTDPDTGEKFNSTVDLSKIKFKKFRLKSDSNGYFDFKLPVSGDVVKFKYLTYSDTKRLSILNEEDEKGLKKKKLMELAESLKDYADSDSDIDRKLKKRVTDAISAIKDYADESEGDDDTPYTHSVTNKMAMSIQAVNGITDRKYINEYISLMNVRDSSALRRYINENEPGLDFNVEVERPESLGGGSISIFLTLDQYIFLNIA